MSSITSIFSIYFKYISSVCAHVPHRPDRWPSGFQAFSRPFPGSEHNKTMQYTQWPAKVVVSNAAFISLYSAQCPGKEPYLNPLGLSASALHVIVLKGEESYSESGKIKKRLAAYHWLLSYLSTHQNENCVHCTCAQFTTRGANAEAGNTKQRLNKTMSCYPRARLVVKFRKDKKEMPKYGSTRSLNPHILLKFVRCDNCQGKFFLERCLLY